MDTFIIHIKADKSNALIEIFKAFNIKYEIASEKGKDDDSKFVKEILKRSKSKKLTKIKDPKKVWESIL